MATKRVASKKAAKRRVVNQKRPPLEIQIMPDGSAVPYVYLDPKEKKHPSGVHWVPVDTSQIYQIELADPPKPFSNGIGPFPTGVAADGGTIILTADPKYSNGRYKYAVTRLKARQWIIISGGGIIVDA